MYVISSLKAAFSAHSLSRSLTSFRYSFPSLLGFRGLRSPPDPSLTVPPPPRNVLEGLSAINLSPPPQSWCPSQQQQPVLRCELMPYRVALDSSRMLQAGEKNPTSIFEALGRSSPKTAAATGLAGLAGDEKLFFLSTPIIKMEIIVWHSERQHSELMLLSVRFC